jgi:uncharacterized protein (DUF433 family)
MAEEHEYKYLGPRYGSSYRQWFVKGRRIRAYTLYEQTLEPEPQTPEEVAEDFDVPVEAVYEAIHYCTHNRELIDQEIEEEWASIRARGLDKPPYVPPDYEPEP